MLTISKEKLEELEQSIGPNCQIAVHIHLGEGGLMIDRIELVARLYQNRVCLSYAHTISREAIRSSAAEEDFFLTDFARLAKTYFSRENGR